VITAQDATLSTRFPYAEDLSVANESVRGGDALRGVNIAPSVRLAL
jgi:hypothetical protein